jgi:hypothetical protein
MHLTELDRWLVTITLILGILGMMWRASSAINRLVETTKANTSALVKLTARVGKMEKLVGMDDE